MTITEVKQFIEDNKETTEVKEYLNSFKVEPTLEVFKEKVTSDSDFISYMDSERDKHTSKALETWKANNLERMVNEKVKELYPAEDPKDSELKQMKLELENMKKETLRKELTNIALTKASELKLPTELVDLLVSSDEETTLANIERFNNSYTQGIETTIKAKLQGNGDNVPKGDSLNTISKEDLGNMSYKELSELKQNKPEVFNSLQE